MASLNDSTKPFKESFSVLCFDVSDLINDPGSNVSFMFNDFAENERKVICFAFGILLVKIKNSKCNISSHHDDEKLAIATSFTCSYSRSLQA